MLFFIFVIALGLAAIRAVVQVLRAPTSRVPGPWYSKWTGLVLDYCALRGKRTNYVHALHQKYGPVVRIGPREVDFLDIDAVKTIYSTRETFRKSQFYRNTVTQGTESIFSTTRVDYHRRHRRLLAGPMAESSLKSMIPQVDARVRLAIEKMEQEMKSRGTADVFKFFLFMATDVIGELTFSESFRMLELGQKNDYARELERVGRVGAIRALFPSLMRLSEFIPIPIPVIQEAKQAGLNVKRYAYESLERHRKLAAANKETKHTLFTKLLEKQEEMTFEEIRDESVSYIVAGSDTTSNTLTYLTWVVANHPKIRDALVKEVQELPDDFSEEQLRHLPLLEQVINETLRMYSAAPAGLPRVVPPEGADLAGYHFDAGTVVCAQAYSMHRDGNVFPDPEAFKPSRWSSPTKAMLDNFMPFGRGPRVCIGQHLAMIELRLATTRFFRAFPKVEVSNLEGFSNADMKPAIFFLHAPSGGRCLLQLK